MRWSQPLLQGPPPIPRFGQTMTLVGSKVIIFGGSSGAHNVLTNDHVALLDLGISIYICTLHFTLFLFCIPCFLSISCWCPFISNAILAETLAWTQIKPAGTTPLPLHYHTSNLYGDRIYYYGGVKKFNGFIVLELGMSFDSMWFLFDLFLLSDHIESLKNRDFNESKEYVQQILNNSLETLEIASQRGTFTPI